MKKIFLDLPKIVQQAVLENLQGYEQVKADESVYCVAAPKQEGAKKIRIGEIVDKIEREFGLCFVLEGMMFELQNQQVKFASKLLKLTEKEAALVKFLHDSVEPQTRAAILVNVWNYSNEADTRTTESHIHRLNQKFKEAFGVKAIEHYDGLYELKISRNY